MSTYRRLALACLVFLGCSLLLVAQIPDLASVTGDPVASETLFSGRTVAAFVLLPGCDACPEVVGWLKHAAEAFPEISFSLLSPENTPELSAAEDEAINVLVDPDGAFGSLFQVERVPSVLVMVEGANVSRLDWPFTEGQLLRKLAESLSVHIIVRNTSDMLGRTAPDFDASDLEGNRLRFLGSEGSPQLLAFLSLGCDPCWEALPVLGQISELVSVDVIAIPESEDGDISEYVDRLESFVSDCTAGSARVLVPHTPADVLDMYELSMSPSFFLVDYRGVISGLWEGREVVPALLESVRSTLGEHDLD